MSQHGQVEYLTTLRYIRRYAPAGAQLLEVGAGTGRYALTLSRMGYDVDAVELVDHNIDILKGKMTPQDMLCVHQGNALDLSRFADGSFDAALLLGPMYHLFADADKRRALAEALRVTRSGGVLFVAYCMNEATIYNWGFCRGNILTGLAQRIVDPDTFACLSDPSLVFELYRKEHIDALAAGLDADRLHFVASDLMTNYMRETVDAMDDDTYQAYLRYHFSICERPDVVGLSHHTLDILRKR
ncbi:MAG: class I SAM-dependent methyltransferase [Eubacteriales bacterium]|nr:class I SAM-dependent methyltransferase [Eubacteriales bacterium]